MHSFPIKDSFDQRFHIILLYCARFFSSFVICWGDTLREEGVACCNIPLATQCLASDDNLTALLELIDKQQNIMVGGWVGHL